MPATTPENTRRTVHAVSELAEMLRALLEDSLPAVWVEGEVSNFRSPSAHWYFTLKDAGAQLRCVMFRNRNLHVRPPPRDGDAVLIRGQVSVYTGRGDLQIIVEHMEPAGEGALLRAFEALKRKLAAEGLFDEALKRPIPEMPRNIGLITSAGAAAAQDVLTTLRRRFPLATVHFFPVPVQGETAAPAIVAALRELPRRTPVDVVLLVRGGGSLEDLWCFNDERVPRAIRSCAVPVVTGVGHEIDFTLADFAADLRAPTPTAAAELTTPDRTELAERLAGLARDLRESMQTRLTHKTDALERIDQRLQRLHPSRRLRDHVQRLDECLLRLQQAQRRHLDNSQRRLQTASRHLALLRPERRIHDARQRLQQADTRLRQHLRRDLDAARHRLQRDDDLLRTLSPEAVLNRGYAVITNDAGKLVRKAGTVAIGQRLDVELHDGHVKVDARQVLPKEQSARG